VIRGIQQIMLRIHLKNDCLQNIRFLAMLEMTSVFLEGRIEAVIKWKQGC